jgi:hypothetical protein
VVRVFSHPQKGFVMHKQFYFLSPVEVVKVTSNNLAEVAEWCGGRVAEAESNRVKGRMDKYVWVPTPKGSNISWAFPGMFITKRLVVNMKGELKATWAVFRRDYFEKNYFETPNDAVDKTWEIENKALKKAEAEKQQKKAVKTPAEFLSDHERRREIKINVGEGAQPGEPVQEPVLSTAEVEAIDEETRARIEQVNREILASTRPSPGRKEIRPLSELEGAISDAVKQDEHYLDDPTHNYSAGAVITNEGPEIGKVRVFQKGSDVYVDMTMDEARAAGVLIDLPGERVISTAGSNVHDRESQREALKPLLPSSPSYQRMEAREEEVEAQDPMAAATELVEKELGGVEIKQAEVVSAYVHDHGFGDACSAGSCEARGDFRYNDGIHVFEDRAIEAFPEDGDRPAGWAEIEMPAAYTETKS